MRRQGLTWKFIGQTPYSPDYVTRVFLFSWLFRTHLTGTIHAKAADMNQVVACSYRHWMLQHRLCFHNLKIILNICDEYLQVWLFYTPNICRVFFKLGTMYPYTNVPTFIIYFLNRFWYQILNNIHKIHFQIQFHPLLTWTPANPFGPRNLSHSSAMSLCFHWKKCTMQLLPFRVLGVFWAWMFATANKRHIRCSSTILQNVVPTLWKCFSVYTARIQGREIL